MYTVREISNDSKGVSGELVGRRTRFSSAKKLAIAKAYDYYYGTVIFRPNGFADFGDSTVWSRYNEETGEWEPTNYKLPIKYA